MKILFKRNNRSDSALPAGNAGEPIWFKDKLYIGSVGSTAGGSVGSTAGDLVLIGPYTASNGIEISEGVIKHSNTSKTKISGLYKITVDNSGHVTAATAVSKSDITGLGIPSTNTTYSAGTGLSLSDTTFNHSNSVTAVTNAGLFKFKYDAQGHITGTTEVTKSDITALGIPGSDTNTHLAHKITFTNAGATTPTGNSVAVITSIPKIETTTSDGNDTVNPTTVNVPTTAYVDNKVAALRTEVGNPMMFRGSLGDGGTVTSLPSNPKAGDTYKVIEETTITNVGTAKVGDTIIYTGTGWVIIPSGDEPKGTVTSVALQVPTGLSVTGSPISSNGTFKIGIASGYTIPQLTDLYSYKSIKGDTTATATASAIGDTLTIAGTAPISTIASTDTITISHDNSGVSAASYPATASSTSQLLYGGTFNVPTFTVDAKGHLTAAGSVTYKIPASDNTDTKVTSAANHYTPSAESGSAITPSDSSPGSYALGTEYTVVTGITLSRDSKGHVTGASVTQQKIKDTNTNDRYTFSTDATTGKFSVTNASTTNTTHAVTLTEIDGGTF